MKLLAAQSKNLRWLFFLRGIYLLLAPGEGQRAKLEQRFARLPVSAQEAVLARVNYYCKPDASFMPGIDSLSVRDFWKTQIGRKNNYFFDLYEVARLFRKDCRFRFHFGDETEVADVPTFIKARPIDGDNANSVLLKLNKVRHFNFVRDRSAWADKRDSLVWRGHARRPNRQALMRQYLDHPLFDLGSTFDGDGSGRWLRPYLTIPQQLQHKFVLSLEGNDVATNLKWILSSGSLCLMPRPRYETWFMEGQLEAGVHYVEVRDDFTDIEERMNWYLDHPIEAKQIIANANAWVDRFRDVINEAMVSMLVMKKYFQLGGCPQ